MKVPGGRTAPTREKFAGGVYFRTFVQGERRSQVYLDYAEPPPIFVQASAEPNLFGLCRAQPKMSRKRLLKTNIFKFYHMSKNEISTLNASLNKEAEIYRELKKQPDWWQRLLLIKGVYVEIRKDDIVDVYYEGGENG